MTTSEQINELAAALAKAQGVMNGAAKDSANPFFKSKYADLASVWEACRKPLTENGLSIIQSPSADGVKVSIETRLLHTSGQWIAGTVTTSAKEDTPQAIGSAITYLRRYALQSFAGVAPEDDDGEAAQGRSTAVSSNGRTSAFGTGNAGSSPAAAAKSARRPLPTSRPDEAPPLTDKDIPF